LERGLCGGSFCWFSSLWLKGEMVPFYHYD
jgi:hypothetical protein